VKVSRDMMNESWNKLTEGGKNHKETFTEGGGDLAVIKLAYTGVIAFSKVKTDFFPGLTHG
jgi:hypothetical protein